VPELLNLMVKMPLDIVAFIPDTWRLTEPVAWTWAVYRNSPEASNEISNPCMKRGKIEIICLRIVKCVIFCSHCVIWIHT
jgi:hypothetical protein